MHSLGYSSLKNNATCSVVVFYVFGDINKSFCYILHCLRQKEGVRVRVKFFLKKSVSLHCPNYCFALTFYTLFSYFQSFFSL